MSVAREQLTANLFLIHELDDPTRTSELALPDQEALRAVADWITTFVARPNEDLGRAGPVCPFVPVSLERKTLWLAPEQIVALSTPEVVELITGYQTLFKETEPIGGDDAVYKSFVVVFTDLSPTRAGDFFGDVLAQLAVPSYTKDGFVLGGFHELNLGSAIYNARFHPFTSPVPFLLIRQAVIFDWKFFLDDDDWLNLWVHRYGESGALALAEELRDLPWRTDPRT